MLSKKETQKSVLPVITKEEISPKPLPIAVFLPVFRWIDKKFLDTSTGQEIMGKYWGFIGLTNLGRVYHVGRKRQSKQGGALLGPKVYGFEALAQALSSRFPVSASEVERMIREATAREDNNCKFVLRSDLVPTSPNRFFGENGWVLVSDYPSTDKTYEKINKALKASGSNLRIQSGLKYKMVLRE